MERRMEFMVVALAILIVLVVVVIIIFRRRRSKRRRIEYIDSLRISTSDSMQSGIAKLHVNHHNLEKKRKVNYYVLRRGVPVKPWFNWADHPGLVSEAVEHGWTRFGFNGYMPCSGSTRSALLGMCASGDQAKEREADISWELCPDSSDFVQKIRLNKVGYGGNNPLGASCVIKTGLPLPGPPLGNSSFPQEAYFEITIMSFLQDSVEGEGVKLIQEMGDANAAQSDSLLHVTSTRSSNSKLKELKHGEEHADAVALSLGLTQGGSLPWKLPGSYTGSIGFNSNGSVYLDGIKLVFEAEKGAWGANTEKVIGCGFDPNQKKVFFTEDSEVVHLIHCKSDDFACPLYPTLAANRDVTVLVNFGQTAFKYAPANAHRTPDPCFITSLTNTPAASLGYEDSRELFSMGRIDAEWLNHCTTKRSQYTVNYDNATIDIDQDSETDLFEIVLDKMNRSINTLVESVD